MPWKTGEMLEGEKKDVVYLYTFPRSITRQMVSNSPYGAKLECWMRLKQIPFELVPTMQFSENTGQIPYIRYNGDYVEDSTIIIEYLTKQCGLDPTEGLTDEQNGIAIAFQRMLDENTCWSYFSHRYVYHPEQYAKVFRPTGETVPSNTGNNELPKKVSLIEHRANCHGIGRKTEEQVAHIGRQDMRAVSKLLGDKPFLFGDKITTVDCVAFGHLTSCLLVKDVDFPHKQVLESECTNLLPYLGRIAEKLWPDWDTVYNANAFD